MIPGDTLLDAFIDANILLVVAFALWSATRFALHRLGLKHAYSIELKLLNGVFLAIAVSPFLVLGLGALQGSGMKTGVNVNLPDRKPRILQYMGGAPTFRAECDEVASKGYAGLEIV